MRRLPGRLLLAGLAAGAVGLPGAAGAEGPTLTATVGPGFSISLTDASRSRVTNLDPGPYTVNVSDLAIDHNFHLHGPGVDERTGVEEAGEAAWAVTLAEGRYEFLCDVHPLSMTGGFTVGNPPASPAPAPPPPPAPARLLGKVGPGAAISLRTASGTRAGSLVAGPYAIAVRDLSARDNFHLRGPGVNRKTGVLERTTATWKVTLSPGTYRYFSDAHAGLAGSVRVKPKPRG